MKSIPSHGLIIVSFWLQNAQQILEATVQSCLIVIPYIDPERVSTKILERFFLTIKLDFPLFLSSFRGKLQGRSLKLAVKESLTLLPSAYISQPRCSRLGVRNYERIILSLGREMFNFN